MPQCRAALWLPWDMTSAAFTMLRRLSWAGLPRQLAQRCWWAHDRELLAQIPINLFENALRQRSPGTGVKLSFYDAPAGSSGHGLGEGTGSKLAPQRLCGPASMRFLTLLPQPAPA